MSVLKAKALIAEALGKLRKAEPVVTFTETPGRTLTMRNYIWRATCLGCGFVAVARTPLTANATLDEHLRYQKALVQVMRAGLPPGVTLSGGHE